MSDQYLWDKSGDADPEVERLEQLLKPLGYDGRPFVLAGSPLQPDRSASRAWQRWTRIAIPLAVAASLLVAVGVLRRPSAVPAAGWSVEVLAGAASASGRPVTGPVRLGTGDRIETAAAGRVRLRAEGIGTLLVGPDSRLRVTDAGGDRQWFALDRGSLEADVSAAPGIFAVETPTTRAIDLGCRYTLEVRGGGAGSLHVTLGWVGLAAEGRESLVPAGAACALRAANGPGTPYFDDATPAFAAALAEIDNGDADRRDPALAALLSAARPVDAITLWHLLSRLDPSSARRVYDRLAELVPPPAPATPEAVLNGEPGALGAWWEAMGLGDLRVLRAGMLRVSGATVPGSERR